MFNELRKRVAEPIRRPINGLRSLLVGLPIDQIGSLAAAPGQLKSLAQMQLSLFSFRYALPILFARQLGIFEALQPAPMRVARLADRCDMHPRAAETLVRVLQAEGLVCIDSEQVSLSKMAAHFLTPRGSTSLLPVIDLVLTYTRHFEQVVDGLKDGQTPDRLNVRGDDATTDSILQAVNAHLAQAGRDFFRQARLPTIDRFIVGSMGVSFSAQLLRRQPDARVTYGCLKHLVRRIPDLRNRYQVDGDRVDGTHAHSGEPSQDQWGAEGYDLVLLTRKMILDPGQRVGQKFAQKAYEVLRPDGVAVFWEAVHPDHGPSPLPLALETVFDLGMSPSAPLKTRSGFARTLTDIGYEAVDYVSCLGGTTTFAVAHKSA